MKKFLCYAFLLCCVFLLFACSGNFDYKQNLTTYNLDVEYNDDEKSLSGSEIISYVNSSKNVLKNVKFHLYPNAFRENAKASVVSKSNETKAYPNGKSYGNISVDNVKVENENSNFEICGEDENILNVSLGDDLYPNDKVQISLNFYVKLPNINHRFGYGNNAVNVCNFYPIACVYENDDFVTKLYNSNGDPFYSEVANYNVNIKYPSDFIIATSGTKVNETKENESNKVSVQAKCVRDFAIVLSNKFETKSSTYNKKISINYFYYTDPTPEKTMDLINEVLRFFEEKVGEYPYSQISVAETNFVHGGMEYPNLVLISDSLDSYDTYQMVIIHELLHQWWYGVVGNNEFNEGWIDEGLTEFCTIYFYEKHPEFNKTMDRMVKASTNSYTTFMKVYKDVLGSVDTSINRPLDAFKTEPEYVYNTYVKGMLMFASIYNVVGEKKFVNALKYYYNSNAYEIVNEQILINCFSKGTGRDLENLFRSWLDGKVVIVGMW